MRRAAKRDGNHAAIRDELRELGLSVFDAGSVGRGFPDLVVGCRGETYLVELKVKGGTLTSHQARFTDRWHGGPIIIARSAEEVLGAIEQHQGETVRVMVT